MLSPQLLARLRAWWREGRRRGVMLPQGWLFPGRDPVNPLTTRQLRRAVHAAAEAARINKRVTPHTLRHSFATQIAYNSCRNRHCPKCQGAAARDWLATRESDLLPVPYFHLVFTLPAAIADLAYQNKAIIYDLLFRASSEALLTIAADPKHLGARIGITAVLHTWGSAMTHHPHVHMIVPGGGLSFDRSKWISCKPGFFLPVRVLSKLFRRLMLAKLAAAHAAGKLQFFGEHAHLAAADAFAAFLAPLKTTSWFVYSKRPFAGPQAVLGASRTATIGRHPKPFT